MKKLVVFAAIAFLSLSAVFAQVLPKSGVKNTLSTAFGLPYGESGDSNRDDVRLYGFFDTLQARVDISQFTMEGMLNWNIINNGGWRIGTNGLTPYYYSNCYNNGTGWWTNPTTDNYYVNFLWHPLDGLDVGMGTRLTWVVGPAPNCNGSYWEPYAHPVQGGLQDAAPDSTGNMVVGYTYYANTYTSWYEGNTKAALGVRYQYKDFIEVGAALPSGVDLGAPVFNLGFKIHPIDILTVSAAVDGLFRGTSDVYAGATADLRYFILDAYLGLNFRSSNNKYGNGAVFQDAGRWGTGAALTFNFEKINLMLRPEIGFTFYNKSNYTFAWYTGARVEWKFAEDFMLGGWSSIGFGAKNNDWDDDPARKDWGGGFVFDIRPDFTWFLNSSNSFTAYFDYQYRHSPNNNNNDLWATGVYWTFKK